MVNLNFVCLQREPQKLNEISEDIRSECSKFGEVKKVVVYDVSVYAAE